MIEIEKLREFFKKDRFAMGIGTVIEEVAPGRAVCSLTPTEQHLNAGDAVQGGVIFTLADFTASVAANTRVSEGMAIVSLQSDIRFLGTARGQELIAIARCVKHGRTTTLYTVEVADELGTQVAFATMNGYAVKR